MVVRNWHEMYPGFRRNQTMVMTLNINLLQEGEKQQRSTAQPVS